VPTYVYKCIPNGHQFEVFQRMSDAPVTACEVCGGEVTRLLFAPAIHFKGSGFHNTDYGTRRRPVGGEGEGGGGDGAAAGDKAAAGAGGNGASNGSGGGETTKATTPAPASSGKTIGLDKA